MKPRIWRQMGCWWCALQVDGSTPAGYGATPLEAFTAWLWVIGRRHCATVAAPQRMQ